MALWMVALLLGPLGAKGLQAWSHERSLLLAPMGVKGLMAGRRALKHPRGPRDLEHDFINPSQHKTSK